MPCYCQIFVKGLSFFRWQFKVKTHRGLWSLLTINIKIQWEIWPHLLITFVSYWNNSIIMLQLWGITLQSRWALVGQRCLRADCVQPVRQQTTRAIHPPPHRLRGRRHEPPRQDLNGWNGICQHAPTMYLWELYLDSEGSHRCGCLSIELTSQTSRLTPVTPWWTACNRTTSQYSTSSIPITHWTIFT